MKTIIYKKLEIKKVGRKFAVETSAYEEGDITPVGITQWGDTEQQAIDKLMKFLSSNGKYNLKCKDL